jgi:hypothetical protein
LSRLGAVAAAWLAVVPACSDPDIADGAFECGDVEPRCPPDFFCGDDGRCRAEVVEAQGGAGGEGGTAGAEAVCGDASCDPPAGEDCVLCPSDCGRCAETCGDARCVDETCVDCPDDCGVCPVDCGDGTCGDDETSENCPADC